MAELVETIKLLKSNAAPGLDNISNNMLKNLSSNFKIYLLQLVNLSIKHAFVPSEWKIAKINMIPKKNNGSNNPNDYRPIIMSGQICGKNNW